MIEAEKKNSYLESAQNYDFQKFTFDSTINELSNVDTEELIKDPKEVFDVFLKYLQESPDKLNKINKKKLEKIQMFISDQGNKDYVLSQYITYIKRFSSDNPKFDDKDKTVFSEIKSNIEKIYN
jgi:LPS O-antigen subunit length determinant protein (WzzB/FepE family)